MRSVYPTLTLPYEIPQCKQTAAWGILVDLQTKVNEASMMLLRSMVPGEWIHEQDRWLWLQWLHMCVMDSQMKKPVIKFWLERQITQKLHTYWLFLRGIDQWPVDSPHRGVGDGFPLQRASNPEKVSLSWRLHSTDEKVVVYPFVLFHLYNVIGGSLDNYLSSLL